MTDPGSQPGTPDGSWVPPHQGAGNAATGDAGWAPQQDAPAAAAEKKGLKKILPVVGSVAAAGIVGVGALTGGFGFGDPEVGDCVQSVGETEFEVVDCGSGDAESRIIGIEEKEVTYDEFMADDSLCASFEKTGYVLWTGAVESEPGTVWCTEPA
jgi:hypothetical protein